MLDPKDSVLVFIHVKKTGGMSLQWAIGQQFKRLFYCSKATITDGLKPLRIEPLDVAKLPNGSAIAQHWPFSDYKEIADRANFVTVAREPQDRIISHYNFYLKHHPKGYSFNEYIERPENIDLYRRMLPPVSQLSEVYLFERYKASVKESKLIKFGKSLVHVNKTPYLYNPAETELKKFREINRGDILLYKDLAEVAL